MVFTKDRSMSVQPHQKVETGWVDINVCILGSHSRMSPEAVEKKYRTLLQNGEAATWPPIVGHWEGNTFVVDDGRHEFIASLMLGRTKTFVAWLVDQAEKVICPVKVVSAATGVA
jgi:hypothetical protein